MGVGDSFEGKYASEAWKVKHLDCIAVEGFLPDSDLERVPTIEPALALMVAQNQLDNRFLDWVRFRYFPRRVHFANILVQTSDLELLPHIHSVPGEFPEAPRTSGYDPRWFAFKFWLAAWWRVSTFGEIPISACLTWLGYNPRAFYMRNAFISACRHGPAVWSFCSPLRFNADVQLGIKDSWEWGQFREPDYYYSLQYERH